MGQSIRKMKWVGGLKFEGSSVYGHKITTDSSEKFGGKGEGYSPTELILFGVSGCTGIDIVSILKKQRQKLTLAAANFDYGFIVQVMSVD